MHKCGCLPLDRENNREALKTVKAATEYIDKDYASVVILSRGHAQQAGGYAAVFTQARSRSRRERTSPVVCVALRNTDRVIHNFPLKKTNIYIDVCRRI